MSVIDCFCLDQSCYDSAYNHQQKPFIAISLHQLMGIKPGRLR